MLYLFIVLGLLLPSLVCSQAVHAPGGDDAAIDSLIGLMTLEEKLGQLNLEGGDWVARAGDISAEQYARIKAGQVGGLLNVFGAEETARLQKTAVEKSRMKIPLLFGLDVIHGYRTTFPIPLAEASTWDPAIVEQAARVAAEEASSAGINWTFAPMADIARDPRWGRIAEGSGEDPCLGSAMAAARVKGFQGKDLRLPTSLLACAKHYVAYGGAEGGRDYNTVDISERTLRETYLPPFRAAVDAGAGSLMSAFNEIGGVPSTANRHTLTEILRGEWGFTGFVVSDWTSIAELIPHGIAGDSAQAGERAITAGVDMDMSSHIYLRDLPRVFRNGQVPMSVLNEAVRRVLREKFRLNLFKDPYRQVTPEREAKAMLTPSALEVARQDARESIVLLKNDHDLLPLPRNLNTVALIGPLADDKAAPLGPWNGLGRPENVTSVLEGIRKALGLGTRVLFARGCGVLGDATEGFDEAKNIAAGADVAILVLGESADMSGEAASRSDIGLPGVQQQLLETIAATGKPVVLLLMNGRPLAIPWAAVHIPAILETWFLGVQAGDAIADVLFGDVNPGGKLPVTFPRSVGQIPLYYSHKNTGRPADTSHFTSKYIDGPIEPLFPFGYGLSYTRFSFSKAHVNVTTIHTDQSLQVSVTVKNEGGRGGDEVVQLYIRDEVARVTRPVLELRDFRRVHLEPGEQRTLSFQLPPSQLSVLGDDMRPHVEPGTFKVFVGPDSMHLQEATFEVVE